MMNQQHYVAGRRLKIGNGVREIGDPVPEAAGWKHLSAYLGTGAIRIVDVPDRFKGLEESLRKSDLTELRQMAIELEIKHSKMRKAELVAAILNAEISAEFDDNKDDEIPTLDVREEFESKNVSQLKDIAKGLEIDGYYKMRKAELVAALIANRLAQEEE